MADAIIYCDSCNKIILPSEIDTGHAIALKHGAMCAACLSKLDPEKRRALKEAIARVTPRHGLPTAAPPPQSPSSKPSGVMARPRDGGRRRMGGVSARGERDTKQSGAGMGVIAAVVGALVAGGVAIALVSGGSGDRPTRTRTVTPQPRPARAEEASGRSGTGNVSPVTGQPIGGWSGGVTTGGLRTREEEDDEETRLFYAKVAFDRARMHFRAKPFEYEETIAKYRIVIKDYGDTKYKEQAEEGIRAVERARSAVSKGPTEDAVSFGGHKYQLFDVILTWKAAKQYCEAHGGHLVTITSREECEFVKGLARDADRNVWLGFSDADHELRWEWITGEPVIFGDWAAGQPDDQGGQENYAHLWRDNGYRWNDVWDDGGGLECRTICEWEDERSASEPRAYSEDVMFEGHTYRLIAKPLSWQDAKAECERLGGHLITISSGGENDLAKRFVRMGLHNVWLGLTDEEHEGRFEWVTGEPLTFTDWRGGEPNNTRGGEHFGELPHWAPYQWNDRMSSALEVAERPYCICEWETARGTAARPEERVALPEGVQRHGDHSYKVFTGKMTWHDAKKRCEELGGHLVTFSSREENDFVRGIVKRDADHTSWIGLTDQDNEGDWRWVTGEPLSYRNWSGGSPKQGDNAEDHAYMFTIGEWNDMAGAEQVLTTPGAYVCEWDFAE